MLTHPFISVLIASMVEAASWTGGGGTARQTVGSNTYRPPVFEDREQELMHRLNRQPLSQAPAASLKRSLGALQQQLFPPIDKSPRSKRSLEDQRPEKS